MKEQQWFNQRIGQIIKQLSPYDNNVLVESLDHAQQLFNLQSRGFSFEEIDFQTSRKKDDDSQINWQLPSNDDILSNLNNTWDNSSWDTNSSSDNSSFDGFGGGGGFDGGGSSSDW